ncbi:MAG TPA: hypothetical protein VEF34_00450 [Syntrophobacteraceae bacterium]|nr:hypothetical protein [Syntrophobacteraceae bacterium]
MFGAETWYALYCQVDHEKAVEQRLSHMGIVSFFADAGKVEP